MLQIRGKFLENQVKKVLEFNPKAFWHKLQPTKTIDGTFVEGEPFDYIYIEKDYQAVFDCKECKDNTWRLYEKDLKQIDKMKKCKNAGFKAYFLVAYEMKDVRMIDVDIVIEYLKENKKSIRKDETFPKWDLLERIKSGLDRK